MKIKQVFLVICFTLSLSANDLKLSLGADLNLNANFSVDQRVLDTINNLPLELRKQTVIAANEILVNVDEVLKNNIDYANKQLLSLSLKVLKELGCRANNTVETLGKELRSVLSFPNWLKFKDKCEKSIESSNHNHGTLQLLKINECYEYETLNRDSKPINISLKAAKLEELYTKGVCTLIDGSDEIKLDVLENKAKYTMLFKLWNNSQDICEDAKSCFYRKDALLAKKLKSSLPIDKVGLEKKRQELSSNYWKLAKGGNCNIHCIEENLLKLEAINNKLDFNTIKRIRAAKELMKKAETLANDAKTKSKNALELSKSFNNVSKAEELKKTSWDNAHEGLRIAELAYDKDKNLEEQLNKIKQIHKYIKSSFIQIRTSIDNTTENYNEQKEKERLETEKLKKAIAEAERQLDVKDSGIKY